MGSISIPVAAAAIGAAGSIGGALISSSAAGSAADTQAAAANQASANAMQQYAQTRADLAPFRTTGANALGTLSNIFGLGSDTPAAAAAQPASAPSFADASAGTPNLPPGQTLQLLGTNGFDGSAQPGYYAVLDANGNIVRQFPEGFDLQTVNQMLGGASSANAAGAPAAAASTPTPGSALAAYGLPGLTFNPGDYGLSGTIFQPTQASLEATPGYQFNLSQGLKAVQNSNAAKGLGVSGAALRGAADYATGLADNTLQTQANIFNTNLANSQGVFQANLNNVLNPLMYLSNQGQNAAATTGQQGLQAVGNANNALIGGANARAAGTVGSANALASGLSGVGNAASNYMLFNQLSNGGGGGGFIDSGTWG